MPTTGNPKGARTAIWLLVIAFVAGGAGWCSKADSAELEANATTVGIGQLAIGGDYCALDSMLITRELDGRNWLAGLITHGGGQCRGEYVGANVGAFAAHQRFMGPRRRFAIAFGAGAFEHGDIGIGPESVLEDDTEPRRYDSVQFVAAVIVRAYLLDGGKLVLDAAHFSTGGSTWFNPGKHSLGLSYRF